MDLRPFGASIALALAIAMAGPCPAVSDHFAVATSRDSIYIVREGGTWAGGQSTKTLYTGGSSLSEIAVSGNWVFAADSSTGSLVVGRIENVLGSPSLSHVRSIELGISKPTAVSVDALTGGIYVTGNSSSGGAYKYAYVTPEGGDWTGTINVSSTSLAAYALRDVASLPSGGAVIASELSNDTMAQATHKTPVNGAAAGATVQVTGDYKPSIPSAVTTLLDLAYLTSRVGQEGNDIYGTLEVVSAAGTGTALSSNRLPKDLDPQDVVAFTIGADRYLALIGVTRSQTTNVAEAWRIQLDAVGLPTGTLDGTSFVFTGENIDGQKCAVSGDGQVFWSTHPGMNSIGATISALSASDWSTVLWDGMATSSVSIGNVAAFNYVPEPSSLLALAAFGGLFAAKIRRRMA